MPPRADLTNRRFGFLVAREPVGKTSTGMHVWRCECDCGSFVDIPVSHLTSGHTRSCGCLRTQDDYDLSNDYGILILADGRECMFDMEDYDILRKYHWSARKDGHVRAFVNGRQVELARYILEQNGVYIPEDKVVDHIDINPLNNRKYNLRICSFRENRMNHSLFKSNSSGYSGVSYRKDKDQWIARITIDYERLFLGYFDTKEEAIRARQEAEEKYYGEYSSRR